MTETGVTKGIHYLAWELRSAPHKKRPNCAMNEGKAKQKKAVWVKQDETQTNLPI